MTVEPEQFLGVMVSSTFTDLKEHRLSLMTIIDNFPLKPIGMEFNDDNTDIDVIESSLISVRRSAAYICVIGKKYGQTPVCLVRNPDRLSLTELEFNEAMELGRPILLFLMEANHPLIEKDVELDSTKRIKLAQFIERAKSMQNGSGVDRVYRTFDSVENFTKEAIYAVGRLVHLLKQGTVVKVSGAELAELKEPVLIKPKEFFAVPRYMASHEFVGRKSELATLDKWATEADTNPMLLFEAIGGSGKSMLTWEWTTKHAVTAREDWAGRFWYSFYEGGAQMVDFCRKALAYITASPVEKFDNLRTPEISHQLIEELQRRPWLLILDGLERVLVAYNRIDAAQIRDDMVNESKDQIAKRNPCAAIRPDDDELLHLLATAAPSKILVSSRLTPSSLINRSGSLVPGVQREMLLGLRPPDAVQLMRNAGIKGNEKAIRDYIQNNCGCHPLVVGVLAGLINDYLSDRGNFDAWRDASDGGRSLNFANLDLTAKRTHILDTAISALPDEGVKLLQTLALLLKGADYELLKKLNPHIPFEDNMLQILPDEELETATQELNSTIKNLEDRGLLQYSHAERRYDLHPIVRGVAIGRMKASEKKLCGEQVINVFNSQTPDTWTNATSINDLAVGLQIITTLSQLGYFERALNQYLGEMSEALRYNCFAYDEVLAIFRPFFPEGWDCETVKLDDASQANAINAVAVVMSNFDMAQATRLLERAINLDIKISREVDLQVTLSNLSVHLYKSSKLASADRIFTLALELGRAINESRAIYQSTSDFLFVLMQAFNLWSHLGDYDRARTIWIEIDSIRSNTDRKSNRLSQIDASRLTHLWRCGELNENHFAEVEEYNKEFESRTVQCMFLTVNGEFLLERGEPQLAIVKLTDAVRLSREVGKKDTKCEALLTIAHLRNGDAIDAFAEAERLDDEKDLDQFYVAKLWQELGESDHVNVAARRAHKSAVADGEPYVLRSRLNLTRALLMELGNELPEVPKYDPTNDKPYEWEADVRILIEALKAKL